MPAANNFNISEETVAKLMRNDPEFTNKAIDLTKTQYKIRYTVTAIVTVLYFANQLALFWYMLAVDPRNFVTYIAIILTTIVYIFVTAAAKTTI